MIIGNAGNVKKALGPYHPVYAELLKSFIPLYKSIGSYDMEEQLTLDLINIVSYNTLQDFSFLSESEKNFYYQTRLPDVHSFLAYTSYRKKSNPAITCNAYDFILQNKGLMLKSSTAMRLLILNSKDSILLKKYDDWLSLKKEISNLYATPVDMRTKDVEMEENKANVLEKQLVQSSQAFGDFRKDVQVTWKNVQKNLSPNEAAIEFTNFKVREKNGGNKVIYCALIIKKDLKYPQMVTLFEEKQLTDLLADLKDNNESAVTSVYGSKKITESKLYDLIWKPLEPYLKGIEIINYSPSGLLHKVSFAALSNTNDNYLVDNFKLNMLTSTALVTKTTKAIIDKNSSVSLFGGIDYSIKDTTFSPWNFLDGTLSETNQLNTTLEIQGVKVNYIKAKAATKQEFKTLANNSNIIHIASHGFFFPEPERMETEENKTNNDIVSRSASRSVMLNYIDNDNPLMRSGLVFAGVNDYWNGITEDIDSNGVLTALEVVNIDLRKNKLVVLSACETGLGDIKDGEGVYGLQRAFKMAGTENIIMSLWKVPDQETAEFMKIFYSLLFTEHNINVAFTETQKQMRKKYDPYFWAAFVPKQTIFY
jgi:CHAT domain-containing protein